VVRIEPIGQFVRGARDLRASCCRTEPVAPDRRPIPGNALPRWICAEALAVPEKAGPRPALCGVWARSARFGAARVQNGEPVY
jgi:hypothetical protein